MNTPPRPSLFRGFNIQSLVRPAKAKSIFIPASIRTRVIEAGCLCTALSLIINRSNELVIDDGSRAIELDRMSVVVDGDRGEADRDVDRRAENDSNNARVPFSGERV